MKAGISKIVIVSLLTFASLIFAALLVWANSWSYWSFPAVLGILAITLFFTSTILPRVAGLVKVISNVYVRLDLISMPKRLWDYYLIYRLYRRQFSRLKQALSRNDISLGDKFLRVVLGEKLARNKQFLRESGGLISKHDESNAPNNYFWDIDGHIYMECNHLDVTQHGKSNSLKWRALARVIKKYVCEQRVQSVIVCVGMRTLMQNEQSLIENSAAELAITISNIQLATNEIIPLQIVITECDLIDGMANFYGTSCFRARDSSLGYCFPKKHQLFSTSKLVNVAYRSIYKKLNRMRLSMPIQDNQSDSSIESYYIPEKVLSYKKNLRIYMDALMSGIRVKELTPLASIHFVANRSSFVNSCSMQPEINSGENNSNKIKFMSAREILSAVIPNVDCSTRGYIIKSCRSKLVFKYADAVLPAIYTSVFLLVTLVFFRNIYDLSHLKNIERHFVNTSIHTTNQLQFVDAFGSKLSKLVSVNQNRWLPNFGFGQADHTLEKLKRHYLQMMDKTVLLDAEKYLDESLDLISEVPSPKLLLMHATFLRHRINLLRHRLSGGLLNSANQKIKYLDFGILIPGQNNSKTSILVEFLSKNFSKYLRWQNDKTQISAMINVDQKRLHKLVMNKNIDLAWISHSVKEHPANVEYSLQQLTSISGPALNQKHILLDSAYTKIGRDTVLALLDDIGEYKPTTHSYTDILPTSYNYAPISPQNVNVNAVSHQANYLQIYSDNYVAAWEQYLNYYKKGFYSLSSENYSSYAATVANNNSLYEILIEQAYSNLLPINDSILLNSGEQPIWLRDIMVLGNLITRVSTERESVEIRSSGDVIAKTKNLIRNLSDYSVAAEKITLDSTKSNSHLLYLDYTHQLALIFENARQPIQAFSLLSNYLDESTDIQGEKQVSIRAANKLLLQIEQTYFDSEHSLAKDLLRSQMQDVTRYVVTQAERHIQTSWEGIYHSKFINNLDPRQKSEIFQQNSEFWTFFKDITKLFVSRNKSGIYQARDIFGQNISFTKEYLHALFIGEKTSGLKDNVYQVDIDTTPSGVNSSSVATPTETRLKLNCGKNSVTIVNKNYPTHKSISINPLECTEISIEILFDSVVLIKRYVGHWCYFDFRNDFRSGSMNVRSKDMEVTPGNVVPYGVSKIRVGYRIKEAREISLLTGLRNVKVTEKITGSTLL